MYSKNSVAAKIVAGVAGLSMALSMSTAFAQTTTMTSAELTAQINSLLATIASLQAQLAGVQGGSTTGATATFTTDLTIGSTGASVSALQTWLESKGYLVMPVGVAKGYFGSLTASALAKYQMAKGITPAVGYFGPVTRAAVNAEAGTTTGGGTTTPGTSASGKEGQITNIDNLNADVENEVNEGGEENVLGVEFDAEDSEITVDRVDVDITVGSGGSSQLDNYITDVSLWLDGKKLATQDVDEGDEDDDVYSFRFSGLKGMVAEDDTAELYVMVSAVNNVDSDDTDVDLSVDIPADGIRAVDGAGISETYVDAGDVTAETFNIVEGDAGDLDLSAPSSDNEDRIVSVSADNDTDGVEIMNFTLESNASDNNVDSIEIDLATTTSTTTGFASVINRLTLLADGKEVGSESISNGAAGGATVVFDDLDLDIDEDDEVVFTVEADFNDDADQREGYSFEATVDASEIDAEDAEGDDVTVTGDVTGGEIELRTTGISAEFTSATESRTNGTIAGDADTVDFTIKFSVTAVGDEDVYIDGDMVQGIVSPTTATAGTSWATTTDSSTGTSTYTAILTPDDGYQSGDDTNTSGDKRLKIESGETRDFTFAVSIPAGGDNTAAGVRLTGIKWDTVNQDNMSNLYDFDFTSFTTDTITGLQIR